MSWQKTGYSELFTVIIFSLFWARHFLLSLPYTVLPNVLKGIGWAGSLLSPLPCSSYIPDLYHTPLFIHKQVIWAFLALNNYIFLTYQLFFSYK